ncbi:ECF transporter S component [Gracilibacillus sp. YIM 98692]|uniref:ECF transporter S component n=1 Tax=Gracilibacillus sp. YIM 98692 TaxID=2663532 RepID=UPI0013D0FE7F|nr:ECF transporter S component [Gracilibacillus sp. YIM 98692]
MQTRKLTIISLMAALAVVGRIAFQWIPNVQPVTSLLIICGGYLGPIYAVLLAVVTTFVSNLVLGLGFWTIWQTLAWGLIGVLSGWIGKIKHEKIRFAMSIIFGFISAYLYGLLLTVGTFSFSGAFLPYYMAGLPFDTFHAIGNVLFMIILYPTCTYIFSLFYHDEQSSVPPFKT